jgi:hypothetical protein
VAVCVVALEIARKAGRFRGIFAAGVSDMCGATNQNSVSCASSFPGLSVAQRIKYIIKNRKLEIENFAVRRKGTVMDDIPVETV